MRGESHRRLVVFLGPAMAMPFLTGGTVTATLVAALVMLWLIRRATFERKGSVVAGDVDYQRVAPLCGAITPVPGGVGPLTVAMLLANTLTASRRRQNAEIA